ncbi:phytosulfokines 2-like [Diospyros lotus]|uniref:phytosulfokines 2-like n=1 Tax=Diospyros lotus TaxID=55363 RepID=UPI00225BB403|nr:phytosulfokines 2-like [Diospyros lotus]XP_052172429.1 phytosulfokines 2-like isoform X1 [Diospyros lotus]XP_052174105.1 phytosulfokines 2-like [Diospyros lotus]
MKQISHQAILTVLLLFSLHSVASARLLPPHQVGKQVKINGIGITHADSSINTQEDDSFTQMGREECNEKDEDCMRRMVAEAHLDYVYTQPGPDYGQP